MGGWGAERARGETDMSSEMSSGIHKSPTQIMVIGCNKCAICGRPHSLLNFVPSTTAATTASTTGAAVEVLAATAAAAATTTEVLAATAVEVLAVTTTAVAAEQQ